MRAVFFEILSLLRDILALSPRDVLVLSDSQVPVKALRDMECSGTSSGIWPAFAPLISQIPNLMIRWIPGHMRILGNEITDWLAKKACELALEPGRFQDADFGFGCYACIREQQLAQWRLWHTEQGHIYYRGTPQDFKHQRRLTRLDLFAIIRIRSGTGMVGHDECYGSDGRHHWTTYDRYADGRPASNTLYDNSKIGTSVDWIRKHDMLGLGIPSNTCRCGNINVAFSNPFDGTACIVYNGRRIVVDVAPPTYRCDDCNLCHSSAGCSLPALKIAHSYYFVAPCVRHGLQTARPVIAGILARTWHAQVLVEGGFGPGLSCCGRSLTWQSRLSWRLSGSTPFIPGNCISKKNQFALFAFHRTLHLPGCVLWDNFFEVM